MSDDDWHKVIDVNLSGAFFIAQAAFRLVQAREATAQRLDPAVNLGPVVAVPRFGWLHGGSPARERRASRWDCAALRLTARPHLKNGPASARPVLPATGAGRGVGEVLRLMGDEAAGELHDAHRVGGHAIVGDHALAHPYVPVAGDPEHGKVPVRRMATALRRNGRAAGTVPRIAGNPRWRPLRRWRAPPRCLPARRPANAP